MKKRARRSPAFRRVESALELPDGILGHCTCMEWTDNRRVRVDGCCEVREYDDDRVEVLVAGGAVRFWGQNMQLGFLNTDSIVITGRIQSVEFLGE